ncbi:MAG: hypothetical protein JO257_24640 [Deltaproteobacteria bacterium]|nr:hypothetical protein [Deltaproteobacteria bacterium]
MTARSAFRLGQAIGGLVALALAIGVFAWDDVRRLTADEQNRDAAAWFYDRDAAPGQTLGGNVWVEHGAIEHVSVYRWTARDRPDMAVDTIGDVWVPERQAASTQDFTFTVPADAGPGDTLDLELEIHRTRGEPIELRHAVTLISGGASALRRLGKALAALVLLGLLTAAVFGLKRRAMRRAGQESALWLVPAVGLGVLSFVPLAEQATRLHGWIFMSSALAVWTIVAFAIAERLNRRIGLVPYTAVPLLVEMAGHEAFREANVNAPIRPVGELENAWAAIGLLVRRAGRELIVTGPGRRFAVVPVPASEVVGGAPLIIRASDPEYADLLVASASDVLGEMRFEAAG